MSQTQKTHFIELANSLLNQPSLEWLDRVYLESLILNFDYDYQLNQLQIDRIKKLTERYIGYGLEG